MVASLLGTITLNLFDVFLNCPRTVNESTQQYSLTILSSKSQLFSLLVRAAVSSSLRIVCSFVGMTLGLPSNRLQFTHPLETRLSGHTPRNHIHWHKNM